MTQSAVATEVPSTKSSLGRAGPSRRLVKLLGYWCLAALAVSAARIWLPQSAQLLQTLWWTAGALLIGAALLDFLTGRRVLGLGANANCPVIWPWACVTVRD